MLVTCACKTHAPCLHTGACVHKQRSCFHEVVPPSLSEFLCDIKAGERTRSQTTVHLNRLAGDGREGRAGGPERE